MPLKPPEQDIQQQALLLTDICLFSSGKMAVVVNRSIASKFLFAVETFRSARFSNISVQAKETKDALFAIDDMTDETC